MNPPPLAPSVDESSPRASTAMVVLGALFIIGWLTISALWFMVSMMGTLMANDSGAASGESHMTLLVAMICGQGMTTLAGISAGMAFIWRARRWLLVGLSALLLVAGALCQYGSLHWFFSSSHASP